jgi:hypothetical protein
MPGPTEARKGELKGFTLAMKDRVTKALTRRSRTSYLTPPNHPASDRDGGPGRAAPLNGCLRQ